MQQMIWRCCGGSVSALPQQLSSCGGGLLAALHWHLPPLLQQQQSGVAPSSSDSWGSGVRGMAARTHKLSLKKANNRASWMAVQPFLEQQPQQEHEKQPLPPPIDTALPPLPVQHEPPLHRRIGRITGPYAVVRQPCFAVLESGGSQFKVTADDVIYHNKIPGVHVNDVLEFGKVLLLGGLSETTVGRPFVPGASVVAAVEETFKDAKVHVYKKKKRKRYSKLYGHRSHITALRILEVRQPDAEAAAAALEAAAAAEALPSSSVATRQLDARAAVAVPDDGGDADAGQQQQQQQQDEQPTRLPLHLLPGRQHGPPAVTWAPGSSPSSSSPSS